MPESRAKPQAGPAVSFSCLLDEELAEIEALRKKRQWNADQSSSENQPVINPDRPSREAKPTEKQFVIADSDRTASRTPECEQNADSVFDRAHRTSLVGLAFSGGGIRSATFNLGVLQRLAKLGLLPMFDYISTVSGGGTSEAGYVHGFYAPDRIKRPESAERLNKPIFWRRSRLFKKV